MKVLIIEDNEAEARILARLLELNFEKPHLLLTGLGKKGIELARHEQPDVIILDLTLPDMNGFEVLRSIRSFSKSPVIIVTAWADKVYEEEARELHATDYIIKPFSHNDLLAKLRACLPCPKPL